MHSDHRYLPRRRFAGVMLALQPIAVSLLIVAACADGYSSRQWFAQAIEPLPLPQMQAGTRESLPEGCKPAPEDLPLSELTADIRPRNPQDREVVLGETLPEDCAAHVFTEAQFLSIGLSCDSCRAKWCDVLRLANFRHKPLYFEEPCLERCGLPYCCCQPAASAVHFYGTALLMPVNVFCVCPCSCVPAQYGCR
jgi:hypothetical protein